MIITSSLILLVVFFFSIALVYASVGFGGGSSYLAILSLYISDFLVIKTTGLLCNLVVVSGSTYLFGKQGYLDWKKSLPIIVSGIPFAYYGATIHLKQKSFFIALGLVLALSGLLLLIQVIKSKKQAELRKTNMIFDIVLGAGIGFLSGLVGIGGGIILSPVLNLVRWDQPRKIAALAAVYILLNSLAGLTGQLQSHNFRIQAPLIWILLVAVFLGGQLGSRISLSKLQPAWIKGLTGILVCYIGAKLVLKYTNGIDI